MKRCIYAGADFGTRRKRRRAIEEILVVITAIRDAEQNSLNNVPENLQYTESVEIGEFALGTLDEVIDMLACIY